MFHPSCCKRESFLADSCMCSALCTLLYAMFLISFALIDISGYYLFFLCLIMNYHCKLGFVCYDERYKLPS